MKADEEASPSPRACAVCEECNRNAAKYRCPGCGLRSCGLECVNSHKRRTSCSGKRDRTAFVPISEFDDNCLHSDYHFLEEAVRLTDVARRTREQFGGLEHGVSPIQVALRKQAKNRNITLQFLANGMSRRVDNSSRYCNKFKRINWRIEWVFDSTDVRLADAGVDENLLLRTAIEKRLAPVAGACVAPAGKLRDFLRVPLDELKFFIRKEPCSAEKRVYYELQSSDPIGAQLAYKCIIEYPVIYVALPEGTSRFPLADDQPEVRPTKIIAEAFQPPFPDTQECEKIKVFREEEIREDEELEEGELT